MKAKKKENENNITEGKQSHEIDIVMCELQGVSKKAKKSFVIPGHIRVKKNDELIWCTKDTGAKLIFPKNELFEMQQCEIKNKDKIKLTVKDSARKGRYTYAVITDDGEFAEGGSFPVIIVE